MSPLIGRSAPYESLLSASFEQWGSAHVAELAHALAAVEAELGRIAAWGSELADRLLGGGRLLVAGNGGSAAQAQHLTAELVGRFDRDRVPLAALALHCDTSSVTAIANDYGYAEVFRRQVTAHGRPRDILLCLSASGESPNLLTAADGARELGMTSWALTGPAPNPLADRCDDAACIAGRTSATTQEIHLVTLHLLCAAIDFGVAGFASRRDRVIAPMVSRTAS